MMKNLIKQYVLRTKNFILTEILRGIIIIFLAWLIQLEIRTADLNILIILFAVLTFRVLIENSRSKKFIELSLNLQQSIRMRLHKKIFSESSSNLNSGQLLTLVFDTVDSFDDLFTHVMPNVLSMLILIPMILVVAAIIDPMTALIFLLTLPVAPFLLYLIGQAVSAKNQRAWSALSKLNGDFKELLTAVTTLKIFKQIGPALQKLKSTSEQSAEATLDVLKLAFISAFALELITTLSIALIAVTVGLRLVESQIDFGIALWLLILAPEFFAPIRSIGVAFHSAVKAKDAINLIEDYLNMNAAKIVTHVETNINFAAKLIDVTFVYPNKISPVLENINMIFRKGAVTVVTGESGAGKSTLLKILAGIYQPTAGEIFINSPKIAYVPQRPHLFSTTIRENLTLFQSADDETIKKILAEVDLNLNPNDEINSLSRGQLQRLGLARSLLKGAQIMILDEPTAGLDLETEQTILEMLKMYRQHCTMIIASHRPAVIDFADEIISLDR